MADTDDRITIKSRDFVRYGLGELLDAAEDGKNVGIVSPYRHPKRRYRLVPEDYTKEPK